MRELLVNLAKNENMGIVISSHNLAELDNLVNKVCIIKNGEIIETSGITEIKKETKANYKIFEVNNIEKIKSDTVLRIETGKLYKDDEYYYYEDDILGMPDFRRWLRSYGSSITVLEPQTLIDEITENTKKTLSYYNKLKSIMA